MTTIVRATALLRRGMLATAVAGALVLGGLAAALNLDQAVDHNTVSVVAGGGHWSG